MEFQTPKPVVSVRVVSEDGELGASCREIMAAHATVQWRITVGFPPAGPEDDLYIWDGTDALVFPEWVRGTAGKHLFLVERKRLAEFQERAPFAQGSILLKPVAQPTLTAFLGLAIAAHAARISSTESLRAVRDQMLQCVIQANLRLQEYDQDRTNFLARAVHDFRAPLTAINGYCGLLLEDAVGPLSAEQKEVLRRMQQSAQRLSKLAVAMFDLSVGRFRRDDTDLQCGDLRDAVHQAIHEISPLALEKQIQIAVDLAAPGDRDLRFDHGQMVQVLVNLLDNACKFTPRGGYVEIRGFPWMWERRTAGAFSKQVERRVRAMREPNAYRVDVCDSGMRIDPEFLEEIFEEYTSYSSSGDRSGGGLGLAICRMILSQHQGRVWAGNLEHGPVFSFVLPLHQRTTGAVEPAVSSSTQAGLKRVTIHASSQY